MLPAAASRLCRAVTRQALKAAPRLTALPRGPRFVSCNPVQGQSLFFSTGTHDCSRLAEVGRPHELALLFGLRPPAVLRQDTWKLVGLARPKGIVVPGSMRHFSGTSEKKEGEGGGGQRNVDPVELLKAIERCENVKEMLRLWAG